MRVTVVSRIYRPEPSAASLWLGAVVDALVERGHEIDVVTTRPPAGIAAPRDERERVRRARALRDGNGYVRGYLPYASFDIPLAFRLLFARRPDVILVEPPPTTGAVVRAVCALRRIPYVYDAADVWSDAADMATSSGTVVRILRSLERFAMNGAAQIVTISQGVASRLQALGVLPQITVTGFGAAVDDFPYVEQPTEPLFVYAGSYSAWHGADMLVEAFAQFSSQHPDHRLRFIGTGTERADLERLAAERGIGQSVEFLDAMPAADLVPHLSRAVASLASLKPGTGYEYAFTSKAYSSLAAGCPVIFTGPGPTGPFLKDANTHARAGAVAAYRPEAVVEAMRALVADPLTPTERHALSTWVAATHSLSAVANRVADVVERVGART